MKNKGGRPPIKQGEIRIPTSVSLSNDERIQLRKLGGSKWLRETLRKANEANGNHG